jgi:hypothetical protein
MGGKWGSKLAAVVGCHFVVSVEREWVSMGSKGKSVGLEAGGGCSAAVEFVWMRYGGYSGSTSFIVFGGEVKYLQVICNTVFMEDIPNTHTLRRWNIYGW